MKRNYYRYYSAQTVQHVVNKTYVILQMEARQCIRSSDWASFERRVVQIPEWAWNISLFQKCTHQVWGPPTLIFNRYRGSFSDVKRLGCEWITQLRLMARLRMSGVTHLLPLYAFMSWRGTTQTFLFTLQYRWTETTLVNFYNVITDYSYLNFKNRASHI